MYIDPKILQKLNITQTQFNKLYNIFLPLELLSIVLCLFVCITYIVFKNKFPARLVLSMSSFVLLNNVTDIWIVFTGSELYFESHACYAQGLLEQLAGIGCVVLWLCISVNMFFSFILGVKTQIYERYMHICCWLFCIITVGLSVPYIGISALWCWIDVPVWQFTLYYGPMAVSLLIGGGFQIATVYTILKMNKQRVNKTEIPMHILRQIIFVSWFFLLFLFFFCAQAIYFFVSK